MQSSYKYLYGVAVVLIVATAVVATSATRQSAFGAAPTSDTASNLTTLLGGSGTIAAVIGGIMQLLTIIRNSQGTNVENAPHQAIFSAILAAMDVANGKAAETKGSQTLGKGTLSWDVKFVPVEPPPVTPA